MYLEIDSSSVVALSLRTIRGKVAPEGLIPVLIREGDRESSHSRI